MRPGEGPIIHQGGNVHVSKQVKNKGWLVVMAGTTINLALGILYTWSIFKGEIRSSIESGAGLFQWDLASINDPYAVCCLVFAFAMILAGKCQDRLGPKFTALIGGLLVGAGFIMISQTTSYWGWVIGFGVLVGTGLGFGYSSATPPALKWFPPAKTGLVAGIVVSGFGLASVYIAPLAKYLLGSYGLQTSMLIFGVAFAIVVGVFANLLVNPPKGYSVTEAASDADTVASTATPSNLEVTPSQMVKSVKFYLLWTIFFIGSGAGLMVIGSVAGMAKKSLGEMAFVAVALVAVGNASGRIVAGMLSDRIGRSQTLVIMLLFQALLMFAAIPVMGAASGSAVLLVLLATFIGFNYGTNLALFPSFAKDLWGLKNFGTNYGILFSAWGVGGFVMGRASQMIQANTGSYNMSFMIAGIALVFGAVLTLKLSEKKAVVEDGESHAASIAQTRLRVNHSWLLRPSKN